MNAIYSEAGKKALQILKQPTKEVNSGTFYARPETPYFVDTDEYSKDKVRIVVYCDMRFSDIIGDSDEWDKREECVIPADSFYEVLSKLKAGGEISIQLQADIVESESAWGADCDNPHEIVTHQTVQILLYITISEDMKTVTLKLLRQGNDGFVSYCELQRT
jgi:hypothetical protein